MLDEEKEHQDWIRFNCFVEARKIMKGAVTEDVIEEAKKIERYVSDRQSGAVVKMVKGGKGRKK